MSYTLPIALTRLFDSQLFILKMFDPYDHYAVGGGGVCCIYSSFFHLSHDECFTKTYVECGYIFNVMLLVTMDFVGFC